MSDSQKARHYAYSPIQSQITQLGLEGLKSPISSLGLAGRIFGGDTFVENIDKNIDIAKGYDPANVVPVMEGYTRVSPLDPHRLTVKEADALSNDQSNAKIARIIAEAQAAASGLPAPPSVPTPTITAAPAGTLASGPTPQGDPAQRAAVERAAQTAQDARADRESQGGNRDGVSRDTFGGGATDPAGRDSSGTPNARGGLIHPYANGGISSLNQYNLGSYSDGGRLLKGPGDGVSDSIPATIGKGQPARLADGEFVIPARIVSEIGNGSTEAGARKLYAMMDRIQTGRKKTVGRGKVAVNSRADRHLPA
jgi:hypothetical protein